MLFWIMISLGMKNAEQAKGGIYIRQICKECLMEVVQDSIYISRY